jgi:hypothetical protein
MHNNHRQRIFPVLLPVAVAQHFDAGFDFDQTPFAWKQRNSAPQKKIRHGLKVSATQTAPGHKFSCYSLRTSHSLILNGEDRVKRSGVIHAHL